MTALASTQEQGVPLDYATKYGALYSTLQKANKQPFGPEQQDSMSQLFQKFGQEKEEADRNAELWGQLTTGGQTEFAKYLVDSIVRGQQTGAGAVPGVEVDQVEEETYQWPAVDVFEDRTPKERTQLKTELLKTNNQEYKAVTDSLRKNEERQMKYEQLQRLNDSGKLPSGLQNLNINWTTGDIRFPKLANQETQQFVKTVYDFMSGAKDMFGARVTNFEIGTFLKRLPTLANTEEGRRVILAQMQAIEKLNSLYDESIQDTYDHYGAQRIDRMNVEKIAKEYRKDARKTRLKKRSLNKQLKHRKRMRQKPWLLKGKSQLETQMAR